MSSLDHGTPSLLLPEVQSAVHREPHDVETPVNDNTSAYVETWPDGDPQIFARTLARVLVRRALQEVGAIPADELNESFALAG